MTTLKTVRTAAVCGVTLLVASLARAQGSTGSTDIYRNEFPKSFALAPVLQPQSRAPLVAGSTDLWTTDFQKTFATGKPAPVRDVAHQAGSTDIWSTNFQKAFM